ncbi:hypothetical protein GCM10028775_46660 [Catellatospora paridis]
MCKTRKSRHELRSGYGSRRDPRRAAPRRAHQLTVTPHNAWLAQPTGSPRVTTGTVRRQP